MNTETINYIEFPAKNISATKQFFEQVFDFHFTDFGDKYTTFDSSAGLDGGFFQSDKMANADLGSALLVFYSENLSTSIQKITQAGGHIKQDIFEFPGGKRFHFCDPNGNEFAVWSDK